MEDFNSFGWRERLSIALNKQPRCVSPLL